MKYEVHLRCYFANCDQLITSLTGLLGAQVQGLVAVMQWQQERSNSVLPRFTF